MFGIVLPQNFNAPYRAATLQDFWRRWHMTLSRFLRDYLYIPLGGSRHGLTVTMFALFSTMTLGGLWHGAGLTFVAWGVMHGVGLCVALLWRTYKLPMTPVIGWPLTFLYVVLAWVLFRARSFDEAANIYAALFGHGKLGGVEIETAITVAIAAVASVAGPISWDWTQRLKPSPALGFAIAALAIVSITRIADLWQQRFIYFQF